MTKPCRDRPTDNAEHGVNSAHARASSATWPAKLTVTAPETRTGIGDQREPRLRLPLRTLDDVKAELARLYREGKAGRRAVVDVSKLANVLGILGRLIEATELERRVEELEASRGRQA